MNGITWLTRSVTITRPRSPGATLRPRPVDDAHDRPLRVDVQDGGIVRTGLGDPRDLETGVVAPDRYLKRPFDRVPLGWQQRFGRGDDSARERSPACRPPPAARGRAGPRRTRTPRDGTAGAAPKRAIAALSVASVVSGPASQTCSRPSSHRRAGDRPARRAGRPVEVARARDDDLRVPERSAGPLQEEEIGAGPRVYRRPVQVELERLPGRSEVTRAFAAGRAGSRR